MAFDGLISRIDTEEQRISELEGKIIETLKTKSKEKQTEGKKKPQNPKTRISKNCRTIIEETCIMGITERKERKEIVTENFSKLMSDTKPQIQVSEKI